MDTREYNCFRARPDAAVLSWQSANRLRGVLALGLSTLGAQALGAFGGTPLSLLALFCTYALTVRFCSESAVRLNVAPRRFVVATVLADLLVIFATARLVLTPTYMPAVLVACVLSLQLATFFEDDVAIWTTIAGSVAGYLVLALSLSGGRLDEGQLWLLVVYTFAACAFVRVQQRFHRRVSHLLELFTQARTGDFGAAYDVRADAAPDGVTRIGEAFNRLRAELGPLVVSDALTGCLNLRGFEQECARTLRTAERTGAPVAMLAVDLDRFKSINDEFGHPAGDAVLRETGALLRAQARAGDVVGRLGGEEFGLLLPDCPPDAAQAMCERLLSAVRETAFSSLPNRVVTFSIGVAASPTAPFSLTQLRARADAALYDAKRSGRDRAVVAPEAVITRTSGKSGRRSSGRRIALA